MKDMIARWEKLQADAAEFALIRNPATDKLKRELYARLVDQLRALASELERVITANVGDG
jgi:hypothetical protein